MNDNYYIYNNEAIACCIFLSILNKRKQIDISTSLLILPILLENRIINYLSSNMNVELSLEQLVKSHPKLFVSFNKRYLSLLPICINSFMILSKSKQIEIKDKIFLKENLNFENFELGDRFNKIEKVIPNILRMIEKHSETELYKILNVQL